MHFPLLHVRILPEPLLFRCSRVNVDGAACCRNDHPWPCFHFHFIAYQVNGVDDCRHGNHKSRSSRTSFSLNEAL